MTAWLLKAKSNQRPSTNMTNAPTRTWVQRGQAVLAALAVMGLLYVLVQAWLKPPLPEAAANVRDLPAGCDTALPGLAGRTLDLKTPGGLRYSVVAPSNYQANKQHGLLMMYPPAGFSHEGAERYYQLTRQANEAGYVVVYSAAIPLSGRALRLQSEVVPQVMRQWCIDPQRVVLAGHSDGGSLSTGMAVRRLMPEVPLSHVVVSAAGITASDLQEETCPAAVNVTVLHNPQDDLFPGYGEGAVKWWGQCMQCSEAVQTEASACQVRQCSQGKVLRHCVTSEPHVKLPAVAQHLFEWVQ
jgi:predicted esterase